MIQIEEFERFVARQADRWKLAKATGELAALLKESGGGDVTDRFLQDEAIDTIRDALDKSFAQIDQILQKDEVRQIVAANGADARISPTSTSKSLKKKTARENADAEIHRRVCSWHLSWWSAPS